ncbi:cell division protein FtsW [Microgenomates group bacterium RIFCSPLOWO2_01_FULL_46_13]|nr:MAG: cell division protein FtsW [Microgenomates group bacterium RIFCSPHIGHO2_01_FULL_45_11]OGV94625.1 MAG: cell division protein FtsW [Microgenomates group bacterium RIFCSPLOWO2_01_FULL_46_13]
MPKRLRKTFLKTSKVSSVGKKKPDYLFLGLALFLTLFGLLMVFDASVVEAYQLYGDKFYFVKSQAIWAGLGLMALMGAVLVPSHWWQRLALPLFIVTGVLLVVVLLPGVGIEVQGARRWLNVVSVRLQPSELAKLTLTLYLASWLARHQRLLPFLTITGLIFGLVLLEPDMGTGVILALIALSMYWLAGGAKKYLLVILVVGLLLAGGFIVISPYRFNRLKTYLDPSSDPLGASYHIRQVLIALGSGGLTGQGIGRSRQKFQYLPEATTDSIFAVIAEETGFVGSITIMGAYFIFIQRGLMIASRLQAGFSRLLVGGITVWLAVQSFVNLAAMVALLPLTGIPLPFISYGGSALITSLSAVGIVFRASRDQK